MSRLARLRRCVRQACLPSPSRIDPVLNGVMGVWRSAEGGLAEMAEEYMARESSPLARPERREMSAEPEDIAAVEGDKFVPCPTCGGPCTKTRDDSLTPPFEPNAICWRYDSLVKGEVVAEGFARPAKNYYMGLSDYWSREQNCYPRTYGQQMRVFLDRKPTGSFPVLVIRAKAKEDSITQGGKE